jgi:ketosteroid isomerase-like protein
MKKLISTSLFALTALFFTVSAAAQNAPQKVTDAFSEKYPNVANVEWDHNDDDDEEQGYEAEFVMNGEKFEALFAEDCTWKQTEKSMTREAFPEAIKQTLKRDYGNMPMVEVYELTTPEGTHYKVEMDMETDNDEDEIDYLIFKKDGSLVKEVMDTDDGWFFN